jgi:membrane glycosyltransferase
MMPKFLTSVEALLTGRARQFGGFGWAFASVIADFLLLSLMAPVLMAYQTRSVFQVLMGRDGGWPPNRRGDAAMTLGEAWEASRFIVLAGLAGLAAAHYLTTGLFFWLLPVLVPMVFAPVIVALTSRRADGFGLFVTPEEVDRPRIVALHDEVLARWQRTEGGVSAILSGRGGLEVANG